MSMVKDYLRPSYAHAPDPLHEMECELAVAGSSGRYGRSPPRRDVLMNDIYPSTVRRSYGRAAP